MLSQDNIDKLHLKGIYRCDPVLKWLPSYKRDTPYWCKNWTFKVWRSKDGKYYMRDTYWSTGDENPIELTDENFDMFEYLFDLDNVRYINSYEKWLEYPKEDRWCVPLDSMGINFSKYVVRLGAKKIKEKVVERLQREINYLEQDIASKKRILEGITNGDIDYNLY